VAEIRISKPSRELKTGCIENRLLMLKAITHNVLILYAPSPSRVAA
jgi:hypothetical protein